MTCSDEAEHRRRLDTRVDDVPGLPRVTWDRVVSAAAEPWDNAPHLLLDTALISADDAVERSLQYVDSHQWRTLPEFELVSDAESQSSPESRRLSGPGMRAFVAVADLWGIDETVRRRILGCPEVPTYADWTPTARDGGDLVLDVAVLTRISAVLGIHKALGILFADEEGGLAWLRGPHDAPTFGGRSPLELLSSGGLADLLAVGRFLGAAQTGIYMPPNEVDRGFRPYTDDDLVLS